MYPILILSQIKMDVQGKGNLLLYFLLKKMVITGNKSESEEQYV